VVESKDWEARVGPETAAVYRKALSRTSIINETAYSDYWEAYYYSLSFMFHKTIGKVLNGSDPQVVIADEQRAFDTYLACIAPLNLSDTSVTDVSNQVADCAQKADPWSDLQMWP
jgi:hypothetical protein